MKNVFLINQEEFFLSCKTKDDTGKLLDLVKQFFKPIILFFEIFFIFKCKSSQMGSISWFLKKRSKYLDQTEFLSTSYIISHLRTLLIFSIKC